MNIHIGWWAIPTILSIIMLCIMLRPQPRTRGDYDFGNIFVFFWLVPIMFVWLVYFAILSFTR